MIERHLDYLQFSAILREEICIEKKYSIIPAIKFYSRGYRNEWDFRLYFGNPNSKKALVIASGEPLENLRNAGINDFEILQWGIEIGAEFSRIDLAVTEWVEDNLVTMEDIKSWVKSGLVESNLLEGGVKCIENLCVGGIDVLETLYIGAMQRRGRTGIFRAYDKGIELNLGQYLGTRLELELRSAKAHNTAKRIAESKDIAGNFRTSFNVRSPDFERLMDSDAVPAHRGKGKPKKEENEENEKRWQWLLNQVAPSVRNAIEQDIALGKGTHRARQFALKAGLVENGLYRDFAKWLPNHE